VSQPKIRRAHKDDRAQLCELIQRLYHIDIHEFDLARVERGLLPLLAGDEHGQAWVAMFLETEAPNYRARRFYGMASRQTTQCG
jgi:hypothetical protein